MNPLAWLSPGRWLLYGAFAASLLLGYFTWRSHERGIGAATVQARWDKDKAAQQKVIAAQVATAKQTSADLLSDSLILEKVKNHEIDAINARLSAALVQLRQRPARRPDVPEAATACRGATGADLSADDAGLLVREAARADILRTALGQCQAQYDAAVKAVNGAQLPGTR